MKLENYLMNHGMTLDDLGDFFDLWNFAHNEKLTLKDGWLYFKYLDDDDDDTYFHEYEDDEGEDVIDSIPLNLIKKEIRREIKHPPIREGKFRFTFIGNGTILLQTVAEERKEIQIKYLYKDNKYPEVEFRQFIMSNIKEKKKG